MKTLNFFPYYEQYLLRRSKTTTFRLRLTGLRPGDEVQLTVGWDERDARPLHRARIVAVYSKPLQDFTSTDFEGESPDCKEPESTALVLSSIYRTIVTQDQHVFVVKFQHIRTNEN